ncbi:hypothetical protein PsAD13_03184 [Pseudovibrio sp. Ad13]|uniref:hypothetical protein n=1 Tax=Pseudovibrio sp. Ad13 TaxID=989396 RepID=UPI0007AE5232|nr:hypothetical protein [Pseudovibrio sp. Ad13]KZK82982.1 hypothetical protein PsAD13_03184 [Pseudovibrio sp. Ad13]
MGIKTASVERSNAWFIQNEKTAEYYIGADHELAGKNADLKDCDGSPCFSHNLYEAKLMTEKQALGRAEFLRETIGSRWTAFQADELEVAECWEEA